MNLQHVPTSTQLSLFPVEPVGHPVSPTTPRESRVLRALIKGALFREQVDEIAGCSNGPDLISGLRRRGLEIPCKRITTTDRDGRRCQPGIYRLTANDRALLSDWASEIRAPIAPRHIGH